MLKLLVLLVCVVSVYCTDCGPLDRFKVKQQWVQVYGSHAQNREELGREIWDYMFEHHPTAKALFTRVRPDNIYSSEFNAHSVRVLGGLDICISLLSDEATLQEELVHLRDQHDKRAIPHEYFDHFWNALKHAIPQYAPHFDQDAWEGCFDVIKAGITKDLTDEE